MLLDSLAIGVLGPVGIPVKFECIVPKSSLELDEGIEAPAHL